MSRNPNAKYTRAFEARQIERGAQRIPGGMLPADAAQALAQLLEAGYAPHKAGAIARALREAAQRQGQRPHKAGW